MSSKLHLDPIMVRVALVWLGWTEADLNRAVGRSGRRRVLGRQAMLRDPARIFPGQADVADVLQTAGVPLDWLQPSADRRLTLRQHLGELTAWLRGGPVPVAVVGPFAATCPHGGMRAHARTAKCRVCVAAKAHPAPPPRAPATAPDLATAVREECARGLRGKPLWQAVAARVGRRAATCQRQAYRLGLLGAKS